MKYSDKLALLLKGVRMDDIKTLEAEEAAEMEAEKEKSEKTEEETEDNEKKSDNTEALKAAESMVRELETKLASTQDELTKLNAEIVAINNRTTQSKELPKYEAADVFKELFNKKEEK